LILAIVDHLQICGRIWFYVHPVPDLGQMRPCAS
jgi:hypothetical protein